jgi:3,4-dihydroxy 2-butanone 4-phosphate synthase/GTP cyclohydrolase II
MEVKNNILIDPIEAALADYRAGKMIIVVDDEDRENEGDFMIAAEFATPEAVNFMAREGRGLICTPLTEERCRELQLDLMVGRNSDPHKTAFTVSVDYRHKGNTTGISAQDRSNTILALIDPASKPDDFSRPGHIFPLVAREDGVLRRAGHTEAAIDFARLAGLYPAGVIVEIMNEDGTMARLPQLRVMADRFGLKLVTIKDLITYRLKTETLIETVDPVQMPTRYGDFQMHGFKHKHTGEHHLALVKGTWEPDEPVLVRVHSSCVTGDIFGSYRCDCGDQLHAAMHQIDANGKGVLLYLYQEGRGIGLLNKLKAYKLQEAGLDTLDANLHLGFAADQREYGIGAQILRHLGVRKMKLLTNNPKKRAALLGYGLEIIEQVPIIIPANTHNERYLNTKRDRMGHLMP